MSRPCVKSQVDRTLDWYDLYKPHVRTVYVRAARRTLQQFCHWEWGKGRTGPLYYRGRHLQVYGELTWPS